jgi:hypothetical protein
MIFMTFISMHSVIICVVFSGAYMRCIRLCSLNPGVTCALSMIELPLKKIPVVCDYAVVFPDELSGMPQIEISSLPSNYNRERHLFPRGPTGCHPLNWQS